MNAIGNHILTRTISLLIIGTCLFLAGTADAAAHQTEHRTYVVQYHYTHGQKKASPSWLRRNRDFQHWYLHSRYRSMHRLSWQRLYDIYRIEKRYRLRSRKHHGKKYRDYGYREYRNKTDQRKRRFH